MHRAERLRRAGTGWRWRSALWPALAVDNPAAHPRWTAALRAVPGYAHRRRCRD